MSQFGDPAKDFADDPMWKPAREHFDRLVKALQDIDRHLKAFGYPETFKSRKIARTALSTLKRKK